MGRAVGIEISRQTRYELASAAIAAHVGIDHRRAAIVVTRAAVQRIGGRVRFAPARQHPVAVVPTRIAHANCAHSIDTCFDGIGHVANRAARAAIGDARAEVFLAAVASHIVAITEWGVARADRTGASYTSFAGIGE